MDINLPLLAENPTYYDEEKVKEPKMYFKRVDNGKLYIDADGNHRSCIAKFYKYFKCEREAKLHGVELNEYQISHEHKYIYDELNKLISRNKLSWIVDVERRCISRDDSAGFMQEHYDIKVIARNRRDGVDKEISISTLNGLFTEEGYFFRRYLSKYKWFWR